MEIRKMKQSDDKFAISRIYEEGWRFAYKDIIPQDYLASIPSGHWVPYLDKEGVHTLVFIENGIFVGTSSYCESRFSAFKGMGEIISIYFLPEHIGKGYGKKLLNTVIHELAKLGYRDIFLWALEENHRARKFYERAGFILSGNYLDENIGGKKLREIQYCYHIESFLEY